MKLLSDIDVLGKRVFLRADLDVDVLKTEDSVRLQSLKPTVDWLLEHGAKSILIAGHIGRPEGRDDKLSTKNLLGPLEKILNKPIAFKVDFEQAIDGPILLFENLRFWSGEEANDPEFAKQLAGLADVYINEAFAVSHRAHASMVGVPALLPHAAGLHLQKEVETLSKLLGQSERPFVAIVGGAKLETKIPVIENLAKVADQVLIGGLIAKEFPISNFQFPKANVEIGKLTDNGKDINDESINKFTGIIKNAKTVVWNGPVGYFEGGFDKGTIAIAQAIIDCGAYSVVGGGDTIEFLASKNLLNFSFVSVGGGAMLDFLSGEKLPALEALN